MKESVKQGMFMDLTMPGLNKKPTIETIDLFSKGKTEKFGKTLDLALPN